MSMPHPPAPPPSPAGCPPAPPTAPPAPEPCTARRAAPVLVERLRALDDPAGPETPHSSGARRRWLRLFAVLAVLVPELSCAAFWSSRSAFGDPYQELGLKYGPVESGPITFTVVEKGELEAVRN